MGSQNRPLLGFITGTKNLPNLQVIQASWLDIFYTCKWSLSQAWNCIYIFKSCWWECLWGQQFCLPYLPWPHSANRNGHICVVPDKEARASEGGIITLWYCQHFCQQTLSMCSNLRPALRLSYTFYYIVNVCIVFLSF